MEQQIEALRRQLEQIDHLAGLSVSSSEFVRWYEATKRRITEIFGEDSDHLEKFTHTNFRPWGSLKDPLKDKREQRDAYLGGLHAAKIRLRVMIDELTEKVEANEVSLPTTEEYHNNHISVHRPPSFDDAVVLDITVSKATQIAFSVRYSVTEDALAMARYFGYVEDIDNPPLEPIVRDALAWVHGIIDLRKFDPDEELRIDITSESDPASDDSKPVESVAGELLSALRNVMLDCPDRYRQEPIDTEGFCKILNISHERYMQAAALLLAEEKIACSSDSAEAVQKGFIHIVKQGLEELSPRSQEISVEQVDSFAKVAEVTADAVRHLIPLKLPEAEIKRMLREIIGEPFEQKDWGGERSDLFTTRVMFQGQRTPAAFLLKGPSVRGPLHISGLGKRGDQGQRLFQEPATLYFIQHVDKIGTDVRNHVRGLAVLTAQDATTAQLYYCFLDGVDTARVLVAYGKIPVDSDKPEGRQ